MEQLTVNITTQPTWDAAGAEARRHHVDQLAKDASIRQMQKRAGTQLAQAMPVAQRPDVTLRELADRLEMDRSACRRYVLALGYEPAKRRTASSGYQVALVFTAIQADEIYAVRHAEGYC